MTPEQFQQRIHEMREQFGELFDRYGLMIVGNVAEPETLSDEQWAMRVKELEWVRKEEAKANKL